MKISVVIPVFNEEESINELYKQLLKALSFCKDYEIIFIDDGSYDDSLKNIVSLADKNKKIKVIQFLEIMENPQLYLKDLDTVPEIML